MDKDVTKLLVMDCDSTLSAIEGVDELAAMCSPEIGRKVEELTRQAMAGEIRLDQVFGYRMDLVRPGAAACAEVGEKYIEQVEPDAARTINRLREFGWEPVILSGGFRPVIEPLAKFLGIERIEAVPLSFDAEGNYAGFDADYPTTRNGGKPEVIQRLRAEYGAGTVVMVGDGVSDLETQPLVERFIGFGRYAERERVRDGADRFIRGFAELEDALAGL